jgi:hypothetical protein
VAEAEGGADGLLEDWVVVGELQAMIHKQITHSKVKKRLGNFIAFRELRGTVDY